MFNVQRERCILVYQNSDYAFDVFDFKIPFVKNLDSYQDFIALFRFEANAGVDKKLLSGVFFRIGL